MYCGLGPDEEMPDVQRPLVARDKPRVDPQRSLYQEWLLSAQDLYGVFSLWYGFAGQEGSCMKATRQMRHKTST